MKKAKRKKILFSQCSAKSTAESSPHGMPHGKCKCGFVAHSPEDPLCRSILGLRVQKEMTVVPHRKDHGESSTSDSDWRGTENLAEETTVKAKLIL